MILIASLQSTLARRFFCLLMTIALPMMVSAAGEREETQHLRLYVFDCGELEFEDISPFGLSNDETPTRRMFVPCYLIAHQSGNLLWDAGLDPSIVGKGKLELQAGVYQRYDLSLLDQLSILDLSPEDIDLIALSHMHFDHAGAANHFDEAHLLIQAAEYRAAFEQVEDFPIYNFGLYDRLADNPKTLLNGDHDVFGDGGVTILFTPGHTPGHQALLVRLENSGPILLSGDLFHFKETRTLQRVPVFNPSAEQTLESMQRVETILEETGATLWIEHDLELAQSLHLAPAYYD